MLPSNAIPFYDKDNHSIYTVLVTIVTFQSTSRPIELLIYFSCLTKPKYRLRQPSTTPRLKESVIKISHVYIYKHYSQPPSHLDVIASFNFNSEHTCMLLAFGIERIYSTQISKTLFILACSLYFLLSGISIVPMHP